MAHRLISTRAPHNWTPSGGERVIGTLGGKVYTGTIESRIGQPRKPQILRMSDYTGRIFEGVWIRTDDGKRLIVQEVRPCQ